MPDQPKTAGKPSSIPNLSGAVPLASQALLKKTHGTIASATGETSIAQGDPLEVAAKPANSVSIPAEFGRYRIIRSLGEGAMGVVYLAEDTQLHRQVALKVPQLNESGSDSRLERFYREARLAATLSHPNICPIFDVGEFQGTHFITMAYIQGKPLAALLKSGKPQSERTAANLVRKVALALQEAHVHNVIHRDLKPANIMIDQRGEPIVMDFGLARQVNTPDQAQITHNGAVIGTPSYMSPEQVQGDLESVGTACDIYGLGVILYQMLTGRLPFQGPVVSVLAQIATQTPALPSSFRDRLSPELEAICLQAMAKRATDRFASMGKLAAVLSQYLRNNPAGADKSRNTGAAKPAAANDMRLDACLERLVFEDFHVANLSPLPSIALTKGWFGKWSGRSRRVRIAAVCVAATLLWSGIMIIIERNDGRKTKVSVTELAGETVIGVVQEGRDAQPYDAQKANEVGRLKRQPPEATKQEPKKGNDPPRTFDLLALIDDATATADGGRMVAVTMQHGRFFIPFQLPDGVEEYDVTLKVKRLGVGQGLSLTVPLPAVKRHVNFYLDGFYGSGLQSIDGQDYRLPEITVEGVLFRTGFQSRLVCKIRKDRIETIVDGRSIINWTGDQRRLQAIEGFVLHCHNAHFEVTEVSVSLLAPSSNINPSPASAVKDSADADDSKTTQPGKVAAESPEPDQSKPDESESDESESDDSVSEGTIDLVPQADVGARKRAPSDKVRRLPRPAATEVFRENSKWTGRMKQSFQDDPMQRDFVFLLTVTERNKDTFKATVSINNGKIVFEVLGRIKKWDRISWRTADAKVTEGAVGLHSWRGEIVNGNRLELEFSGTSLDKKATWGVGTAHLQQP